MLGLVVRVFSKWRRAGFLRLLDEHLALARRASRPLSLLALDVDHLAYVNYAYGPVAGETALGMVATVLRAPVRQDQLARFGGDEFYALLPGVALRRRSTSRSRCGGLRSRSRWMMMTSAPRRRAVA